MNPKAPPIGKKKAPPLPAHKQSRPGRQRRSRKRARALSPTVLMTLVVGGIIVLGAFFVFINQKSSSSPTGQTSGNSAFQVGSPGPGAQAPAITLTGTDGKRFDLAAQQGKTVLLYFQEGIGCQPCWDQIKDIEAQWGQFQSLHIDQMVSITSDPLQALQQKVHAEGLSTPVLSDPDLSVSQTYSANQYGMMGTSRDGHTFVLVGPDGRIQWRADYGGAPHYTMYVPVEQLLGDLRAGRQGK